MRRHTVKENLISLAIGTAIGLPIAITASKHWNRTIYDPVPVNYKEVQERQADEHVELITSAPKAMTAEPMTTESIGSIEDDEEVGDCISPEEYDMLAYLVHAEAGNQDQTGKRLVVDVVLNRVDSDSFPNTIEDVLFQKYQFSTIWDGAYDKAKSTVTESDYEAVEQELDNRLDYRILFFTAGNYGQYGTHAYQHGDHYFCYK